jgi:hypothetical protein
MQTPFRYIINLRGYFPFFFFLLWNSIWIATRRWADWLLVCCHSC